MTPNPKMSAREFWEKCHGRHNPGSLTFVEVLDFAEAYLAYHLYRNGTTTEKLKAGLASVGIGWIEPKDLRNQAGKFILDRGVKMGVAVDPADVQTILVDFAKSRQGECPVCKNPRCECGHHREQHEYGLHTPCLSYGCDCKVYRNGQEAVTGKGDCAPLTHRTKRGWMGARSQFDTED
jgi:hypothetical protein